MGTMSFCPECQAEYVEGISNCPDCEIELVDFLPVNETVKIPIGEYETVFEADDAIEAQMIKGLLESSGFECKLIGAHENIYPNLPVKVQVPKQRVDLAKQVIETYQNWGAENSSDIEGSFQ